MSFVAAMSSMIALAGNGGLNVARRMSSNRRYGSMLSFRRAPSLRRWVFKGGVSAASFAATEDCNTKNVDLGIVVAIADGTSAIGANGSLIWDLPEDMALFRKLTTEVKGGEGLNAVIMGRVTWESIPKRFRPLKKRINIIISRNAEFRRICNGMGDPYVLAASGLPEAIDMLSKRDTDLKFSGTAYVIGGEKLYAEAMALPSCQKLYVTRVFKQLEDHEFDRSLPAINEQIYKISNVSDRRVSVNSNLEFQFEVYQRND